MDVDEEEDEEVAIAKAIAESLRAQGGSAQQQSNAPAAKPPSSGTTAAARQEALDHAEAEAEFDREHSGIASHGDVLDGEELVPVPVDESLLSQLLELGFPDVRARKGIVHGKDLEGAVSWLADHENDPVRRIQRQYADAPNYCCTSALYRLIFSQH
jgi:hypothetical protein